jgi:glycosyltransferase involved in cell wall biosynthesis
MHYANNADKAARAGRALRIGVDTICWGLPRGFGRHARCLITAMVQADRRNHYVFFADSAQTAQHLPRPAQVLIVGQRGARANGSRPAADIARMSWAISTTPLDAILFPAVYGYVPILSAAKKLVFFHDTTAESFPRLALHNRSARLLWSAKTAMSRWQADAIIAVSNYSRERIVERFPGLSGRIHVVGEAPDSIFRVLTPPVAVTDSLRATGFRPGRRAIVYVGGYSPHKNLHHLVTAFADIISGKQRADIDLYLVGDYRHDTFFSCYPQIARQVQELRLTDRVIFTGYLADDDLVILLNFATVLVLPSMMEGFGLPAVEAAACGCPVIATTASPIPALLGDAASYVDPKRLDRLKPALEEVVDSQPLRGRMRAAGLAAAARLDWLSEARRLVAIIDNLVGL